MKIRNKTKKRLKSILFIILLSLSILISFVSIFPERVEADTPILYERFNAGDTIHLSFSSTIWKAQIFTVGNTGANENHLVTSLKLKLLRKEPSLGMITVSIKALDGEGKPTGDDLTSGTTDGSTLPVIPGGWREINLTPHKLNASTQYAIVVRSSSINDDGGWRVKLTGGYTGGTNAYSNNGGVDWTLSTADYMFEVYGVKLIQNGEVPTNSSTGISPTPQLYVNCTGADDNLNATWWSNSSGSWVQFASNWTSFPSGTNITQPNSNFSIQNTTYWWSVNLTTNGTYWTNDTYHFTTSGVTTNDATNVEETTATLSGSVIGADGMICGFWYNLSITSSSDFGNNVTVTGTFDDGETFTEAVTGLTSGDYYYVRAWNYKTGIDFFNSTNETYFLTKPYAPSNVSTSISENNISVTWDNATINVTNRTNHVRYKTTGYPASITDGALLYNDSTTNITMVYWYNPGVTYYFSIWTYINESGSPSLFQFSSSSNNSNILSPTRPTDLTVTDYNDTKINLSWTKGDNDTTITRKIGSYPIHSNDGTSVYNGSLETHADTGLTPHTYYFYRAWNWNGTDNSTGYTNVSHWTAPQPPQNVTTETTVTGGVTMDLIITWDNGTGANRSVVRRSYTSQPILPTDGTEIYNSTLNTTTDSDIILSAFYTVFSYNTTTGLFSPGAIVTWYVVYINCYDEETNESLYFDVFISNQDGSQTYESRNNTNPHYLNTSTLPTGDDVKIIVSAASNYSDKSEVSYWGVDENYTITYIVLSQTADSKSSTNVTCINESNDHHSYPPFTLDGDIITILPDNADDFTKIFVNYTHEEYSNRLYYRDIEEIGFFILNAYLPPTEDKQLYLLQVIDEADNTVQDAYIEVERSVNGTYVIISRLLTDANGQADINLISDRDYIFIISKEGYVTENASWTPGTEIFTHTFKIIWEVIPFEPDTFGDIINFYGTLYENNTMRVTFYDLKNEMINSHFTIYENYNGTLTYMGEYNGTTSNDIIFWINVTNATRLHIIVLYMNHSTLREVIDYRIFVYPVHVDREGGTWLENLIIDVVGEFAYGYVLTCLWVFPCVILVAGLGAIGHPGTGILGAGLYSIWLTWNITLPEEAKILTFASIAIVTGFITLVLVKGKKVIH